MSLSPRAQLCKLGWRGRFVSNLKKKKVPLALLIAGNENSYEKNLTIRRLCSVTKAPYGSWNLLPPVYLELLIENCKGGLVFCYTRVTA